VVRFDHASGHYIYIEVQNIEYRVYFEESGEGIPLLCQHSAGSDGQQWRHVLNDDEITARYRVIAPDIPYHGKSQPPGSIEWWKEDYKLTRSFFMDFLVEFSRALGLERPVYMGACMSGCLAPYLALEHPDDFRAVIGLEAVLRNEEIPLDFWDHHDLTDKAQNIDTSRIPVYLLTGEYDPAVSPEDTKQLAEQIKGAKFIEMKGIGHLSLCENPEALKRYLMPILTEIAKT
jgi:pimeloyl-ACP methyl ester carboxylesterase